MADPFTLSQINHYLWQRQGFAGERDPVAGPVVEKEMSPEEARPSRRPASRF
ncbi:MAG: hypothetical protein L0332_31615 [Chloroflexi bacterium]|nr:hypothetical protein [Chloroflexota bacterium]MCI0579773.1 hypothetical protein [Chloroflexota bacterium]MCI0649145.1 hypothetical protein [Chloroflexota bacterium]MCI0731251.1 hypothetical protein [Chloroflexota bacterium]